MESLEDRTIQINVALTTKLGNAAYTQGGGPIFIAAALLAIAERYELYIQKLSGLDRQTPSR